MQTMLGSCVSGILLHVHEQPVNCARADLGCGTHMDCIIFADECQGCVL